MVRLSEKIIENVRKIKNERNLTQAAIASYAGIDESQMSRIMSGKLNLSLDNLEDIATGLGMHPIDIITYPDVFISKKSLKKEELEAVLMVKLKESKKRQIMKYVFGDENLELLNQ